MARFYGKIGYETAEDKGHGIFDNKETVKEYFGDVLQEDRGLVQGESINDNVTVGNRIQIVADAYALAHYFEMRWVEWQGVKFEIRKVEVKAPRLTLSLGDLYNGR